MSVFAPASVAACAVDAAPINTVTTTAFAELCIAPVFMLDLLIVFSMTYEFTKAAAFSETKDQFLAKS